MHREPILPLIQAPGCKSPLAAPLKSFVRESGESITTAEADLSCAPNETGVTFPTQVLAVPGALTHEALLQTPDARTDAYGRQLYHRLLPPFESQITALEDTNPFVTAELEERHWGCVTACLNRRNVTVLRSTNVTTVLDHAGGRR
jgi:hypothetical protein